MTPDNLYKIAIHMLSCNNTPFYTMGYDDEEEYAEQLSSLSDFEDVITSNVNYPV